jgi:hypothetical protein
MNFQSSKSKGFKMNKALLFLAAALLASPAMASKARLSAVQNGNNFVDVQHIFINPADLYSVNDFMTFEMGGTGTATNPNAEGGFVKTMGDYKLGFYVGRLSTTTNAARGLFSAALAATAGMTTPFLGTENPINFFYGRTVGDNKLGVNFYMSSSDVKSSKQKQSTNGVAIGLINSMYQAYAKIGLGSTADTEVGANTFKYKGKTGLEVGGQYNLDQSAQGATVMLIYSVDGMGAEMNSTKISTVSGNKMQLLYNNPVFNSEGFTGFYQVEYHSDSTTTKNEVAGTETKTESTYLPFIVGFEADATSWLTLRGSVSQNILAGSTTEENNTDKDTTPHNTKVAFGSGLKYGKSMLDFTVDAQTTGVVGLGTIGANAGYTYSF